MRSHEFCAVQASTNQDAAPPPGALWFDGRAAAAAARISTISNFLESRLARKASISCGSLSEMMQALRRRGGAGVAGVTACAGTATHVVAVTARTAMPHTAMRRTADESS